MFVSLLLFFCFDTVTVVVYAIALCCDVYCVNRAAGWITVVVLCCSCCRVAVFIDDHIYVVVVLYLLPSRLLLMLCVLVFAFRCR